MFKYFQILILIALTVSCASNTATFQNIIIPKPKTAAYPQSQVEPSIAIHPTNPKIVVAGTVMDDYYFSLDGGKTWTSATLKSEFGVGGDPVLHISEKGIVHYAHLSNPKNSGHKMDRIVCQYKLSVDGKWKDAATEVNGSKIQDKPWIAECPLTGNLYLTWTQFDAYKSTAEEDSSFIFFSKSEDDGKSWSKPIRISKLGGDCLDGNNTVEGAVPTVNNEGVIFVGWTGPHGIRMNKSYDFGKTWLEEELFVTEHPGGWKFDIPGLYRCNGLPITKVDNSKGENDGRIYINWTDQRNGEQDTDNWFVFSDDDGATWSSPIRINQDTSKRHQFFTWMTIDQHSGAVYWVYYDRRNHEDTATDVYLAYSFDGGATIEEICISDKPFVPSEKVFFGDYTNIAAVDGQIRPIWSRMDDGNISLLTALVSEKRLRQNKR